MVAVLSSCTKLTLEPDSPAATGKLSIVVENFTGETDAMRSVAPTQLTANDLSTNYTLKLTGATGRMTLPEQTVTLTNGRGTLGDIPNGTWHLTLTAYPRTGATNTAVLSGSATVTVQNGFSAEAHFTLTPLATGTGTLSLTVNWSQSDLNLMQTDKSKWRRWRMALFHPGTDTLAAGTTAAEWNIDPASNRQNAMSTRITYRGMNGNGTPQIPAGKYDLRFWMWGGGLPEGTILSWREDLYIEAGRVTSAIITVPQLANKPNAPASLSLRQETAKKDGTYPVTLAWGGVYNASSYELEVIEYSAGTKPADDASWQTLSQAAGTVVRTYTAVPASVNNYADGNVHENQLYIDGGLLQGQGQLKMGLQGPGKKFTMRLRSSNGFGTSAWSYCPTEVSIAQVAAPAAPRGFSFTTGMYESATQSFDAYLQWTDGGTDNDGFELELMRFATGTTPRTDSDWSTRQQQGGIVASWKGPAVFGATGDPLRVESGGLGGASSRITVAIKRHAGKYYYAVRLRAYNEGGNSAWVYPAAPSLLMPLPNITWTTSPRQIVGGKNTFTANVRLNDIAGSTCIYQIEFACLFQGNYSSVLSQTTDAAMDTEFTRLRTLAQNNTSAGRGHSWFRNSLNLAIGELNEGVAFPFRVRMLTTSNGATDGTVVDYTPWVYCPKAAQNPDTSYP